MRLTMNKHIGSDFDDFLKEEEIDVDNLNRVFGTPREAIDELFDMIIGCTTIPYEDIRSRQFVAAPQLLVDYLEVIIAEYKTEGDIDAFITTLETTYIPVLRETLDRLDDDRAEKENK